MRTPMLVVLAAATNLAAPRSGAAQGHVTLGIGLGAASSAMSVGSDAQSSSGITIHATAGAFEAGYQPFSTANPLGFEAFTALWVLVGPRLGSRDGLFVRPQVGVQFRWWSGADPVVAQDRGVALGVVVGHDFRVQSGWAITPEFLVRAALIEVEGSVSNRVFEARVRVARRV